MASLDLQGSSLFACSSGWRVPCSLSDVCSPACMDFSSSVFCAECHPLFCDHPYSYRKWLGKQAKGVGGGPRRGQCPSPPPRSPNTPRSISPCRKRTGLTKQHPWERARAWNHPSKPDRPPSLQPSGSCREARPRAARCSPVSTSHQPLPISDPRPPAQWARWELSVQDHKPSSALTRDGQSLPGR